jgi:TonB family protein
MQARSVFALASLIGVGAAGQEAAQPAAAASDNSANQASTSQSIRKPATPPPLVAGAPYYGEEHRVRTRALEDGTRITENWPVRRKFRDAHGRTRIDRPLLTTPNAPENPRVVQLDDPAAGIEYILEPSRKLAHRFRFSSAPPSAAASSPAAPQPGAIAAPPGSTAQTESLGAWVIEGFRAEGVRRTISFAAGDRPLVTVEETWTVPDLQLVVREKLDDPRGVESTTELLKIRAAEPPAFLFQVPSDYRVVEEAGDFAIPFVTRGQPSVPLVLTKVPAAYTDAARRSGIQGTVLLSAVVDESGKAQDIHVEQSVDPGLDQEAVKAVRRWRFRPGVQDGRPVRVPVKVEITFRLND